MKSLNTLFATVAAMVVMCLVQAAYAQTSLLTNLAYTYPTPPVGFTYHWDKHAPAQWELGKVYERTYDANGNAGTPQPYVGALYWVANHKVNGNWVSRGVSGTATAGVGAPAPSAMRVPDGTTNGTMRAGDIYWLYAELDGETYWGRDSLDAPELPSANDIWSYYQSGPGGSLTCPSYCYRLTAPMFGVGTFAFSNNIYLHPKSTIVINSVAPVSRAGVSVRSVCPDPSMGSGYRVQCTKQTDSNGTCSFHVNWSPSHRFEALYDGCWHSIPRQATTTNCPLCFVLNPGGRVTQSFTRNGASVQNVYVWLLNRELIYITPADMPLVSNSVGTVSFTPPSGQQFYMLGETSDGTSTFLIGPCNATTTLPTYSIMALTSPANGASYSSGSAVPLVWSATSGVVTYNLMIRQGTGAWSVYNMGNSTGANLTGAGLGTWQWYVRVLNSNGEVVAQTATRTFTIVAPGQGVVAPLDSMPMNELLDVNELFDEESGNEDVTDNVISCLIVQDENNNVLLPIQGLEKTAIDGIRARIVSDGFDQNSQDDWLNWLFMTPEEQLFYDFWFGGFGNP